MLKTFSWNCEFVAAYFNDHCLMSTSFQIFYPLKTTNVYCCNNLPPLIEAPFFPFPRKIVEPDNEAKSRVMVSHLN